MPQTIEVARVHPPDAADRCAIDTVPGPILFADRTAVEMMGLTYDTPITVILSAEEQAGLAEFLKLGPDHEFVTADLLDVLERLAHAVEGR